MKNRYFKNLIIAKKICKKIDCSLIGFDPNWLVSYKGTSYDIPDWLMGKIAEILGYKWKQDNLPVKKLTLREERILGSWRKEDIEKIISK